MVAQFITSNGIRFLNLPEPLPPEWKIPIPARKRYLSEPLDLTRIFQQPCRLFRRVGDFTYEEVT